MDKNTKIAFLLIALIVIFYPYFMPKQEKPVSEERTVPAKAVEETLLRDNVSEEVAPDFNAPLIATGHTDNGTAPAFVAQKAVDIKIETDLFKAVISTKNGAVRSWKTKNYKSRVDTAKLVELVKQGTENLLSEIHLSNSSELKNIIYETDKEDILLTGAGETADLTLSCRDAEGNLLYTKKFRFYSDKYSFDLVIDTTPVFDLLRQEKAVVMKWPNGVNFTEVSDNGKNTNREEYYRATYAKTADDLEEYDDNDDQEVLRNGILWGATRSKYFEVFMAAEGENFSEFSNYPAHDKPEAHYTSMGFSVGFDKNTDPVKKMLVYFGPMDYEIFKSYGKQFDLTMNWGWDIVKPFSLAIYWTLKFLHNYISNYGLVIIILSLLVNTIVLPFTLKSYKSQAEMKKIQPELKIIKEKYKTDMQKQQQATMELYKKHKVNPFGTCLPTLLPMPILYGMFIVFGATIEFRNADFMLWINDLSLPEIMFTLPFAVPLYGANVGLLPIIMGATMFFQMKDTMGADPNQKMMMWFMPVFMVVLFNNLSSGLILYYTVGNFYRIAQQKLTIKPEPAAAVKK